MPVARAPGRVNLIGDHTDYQDGYCLPMAIDLEVRVSFAPRADGRIVASSDQFGEPVVIPNETLPEWGRVIAAVRSELATRGCEALGFDAEVASTIPVGSGLSSSAAFEVAIALAATDVAGLTLEPRDLALFARAAGLAATGVPCGVLDQMSSTMGRAGHVLLLDCRALTVETVPLPADLGVVVAHSGVERRLEDSEYAHRAAACAAAAERIGVAALRDATLDQVADDPFARHVVSENARVLAFVAALRSGANDHAGALMLDSHASLRDDFAVSTTALDDLVERFVAAGSYGARLTGAGFGGCAVALVPAARTADIVDQIAPHYRAFAVSAADGATIVE